MSNVAKESITRRKLTLLTIVLVSLCVLSACAPPPTQAEAQATASVGGCWPDNVATPRAVTVTPDPRFITPSPMATATLGPGIPTVTRQPTATRLPTTTPYPRCTPGPDETLVPYPTPLPPP